MTQNAQILAALKEGRNITPLDALREFGSFRLAARICQLREMGHSIAMVRVPAGENRTVASYSLLSEAK